MVRKYALVYSSAFCFHLLSCGGSEVLSPSLDESIDPVYQNVLIFGNSITHAKAGASSEWHSNWGMAASDSLLDYAHRIKDSLKYYQPDSEVQISGKGVNFEKRYFLDTISGYQDNNLRQDLDLLIINFGENVVDSLVYPNHLIDSLDILIHQYCDPQVAKVILVTSFWPKPLFDSAISELATKNNYGLANLESTVGHLKYQSYDQYESLATGSHPNDFGMEKIAKIIWSEILKVTNSNN